MLAIRQPIEQGQLGAVQDSAGGHRLLRLQAEHMNTLGRTLSWYDSWHPHLLQRYPSGSAGGPNTLCRPALWRTYAGS